MRMRFLDLEPEEIFANARLGNHRCADFELLWHRALARIRHQRSSGSPGNFHHGLNSRFVRVGILSQYLQEMVTMSPLQAAVFEVIPANDELAIAGAAVNSAISLTYSFLRRCSVNLLFRYGQILLEYWPELPRFTIFASAAYRTGWF